MERSFISINPVNLGTIAICSGFAYLGVVGMTMLVKAVKAKMGAAQ